MGVRSTGQILRRGEGPSGGKGAAYRGLPAGLEADTGASFTSPGTFHGPEDTWFSAHKQFLLDWSQLDHAPGLIGIVERREDLAAHAEVGMVHVDTLGSFGEAQRQAAEVVGGHRSLLRRPKTLLPLPSRALDSEASRGHACLPDTGGLWQIEGSVTCVFPSKPETQVVGEAL